MGTDEQMYVEARVDGAWRPVEPPPLVDSEADEPQEDEWGFWLHPIWTRPGLTPWNFGRDRDSYACMADPALLAGRGFPPDISPELAAWAEAEHSAHESGHAWFTLAGLAAYPERTERLTELMAILRGVAAGLGVGAKDVRVVVWFD